jgi:hypothetical protein
MQQIPSIFDAALQDQQAKACWKRCKTPRKVIEIFCVYTENFQPTKEIDKMYFMTFLKLKHELKSIWNDCSRKYDKKKEIWSL